MDPGDSAVRHRALHDRPVRVAGATCGASRSRAVTAKHGANIVLHRASIVRDPANIVRRCVHHRVHRCEETRTHARAVLRASDACARVRHRR
jgi:hypothetical protein